MHDPFDDSEASLQYDLGVVLHIPHASREIPADVRDSLVLGDRELEREIVRMTDAYTDELFRYRFATAVRFPVSRLVVDPERFPDDADEPMAARGMGSVYTTTSDGRPLREPGGAWSRSELMERYYAPHHAALLEEINYCVHDCGACVVVDCHSFPSRPLPYEDDQNPDRPDLCIGTDGFHTPDSLVKCVVEAAKAEGFSVELNRPFAGALVPLPLYRESEKVFAVMLELNRALYMDEATGEKSAAFDDVQRKLERILDAIGDWRDGGLGLGDGEEESGDYMDRLQAEGTVLGHQDWDSGGPGAGAGRVTAWEYRGVYVVTHDEGYSLYETEEEALAEIGKATDATTEVVIRPGSGSTREGDDGDGF